MNKKTYTSPSVDVIELHGPIIMDTNSDTNRVTENDNGPSITLGDEMESGSATNARSGSISGFWNEEY